jgi:putative ABC transport system ATP-binding protein
MIIALMKTMKDELQTTFLFSTHDTRIIGAVELIYTLEDGQLLGCERGKVS